MMNDQDLMRIVERAVDDAVAAGKVVNKRWLRHCIVVEQLSDLAGESADVARACAYYAFNAIIGKVISKEKKTDPERQEQLRYEGYEYLQKQYQIERNDEPCIVGLEQMTDDELDSKEAEHRAQGDGHHRHADEIRAYKESRRATRRA